MQEESFSTESRQGKRKSKSKFPIVKACAVTLLTVLGAIATIICFVTGKTGLPEIFSVLDLPFLTDWLPQSPQPLALDSYETNPASPSPSCSQSPSQAPSANTAQPPPASAVAVFTQTSASVAAPAATASPVPSTSPSAVLTPAPSYFCAPSPTALPAYELQPPTYNAPSPYDSYMGPSFDSSWYASPQERQPPVYDEYGYGSRQDPYTAPPPFDRSEIDCSAPTFAPGPQDPYEDEYDSGSVIYLDPSLFDKSETEYSGPTLVPDPQDIPEDTHDSGQDIYVDPSIFDESSPDCSGQTFELWQVVP